jgi:hypothetical protein
MSIEQIDSDILEAEQIRARHDGVHATHGYVAVLRLCRESVTDGVWNRTIETAYQKTLRNMRIIDRQGFVRRVT